ncbi:uncharacterized protein LOC107432705 [Ziziphus jujuba]|uniref:Uncharacterized protein LOC107432705 n=2 Tax=Ziziphus jujuba TaxID=326968 RepID=A0ABM3I7F5_ZIZJJ|nr:uncharacterized protein LOC107432705 [Ziziphus jujuba]KAH7512686.1 hypothetical protein FEM48_Zijuj12G0117100 [Ziziphus jujuba var. spinosa]
MSPLFKALLSHQYHSHSFLKPQNFIHQPVSLFSLFPRTLSVSPQSEKHHSNPRKPLDVLFKEAVELCPKSEDRGTESDEENNQVKRGLRELEVELRSLKKSDSDDGKKKGQEKKGSKNSQGRRSIYDVFTNRGRSVDKCIELKREESAVHKELSPDMELFVSHLYKEGYFRDANFLRRNSSGNLDFSCFEDSYGRGFIKCAVEKFAKDNQEIAKWVSGRDLKKVALFGCPSLSRRSVFSAKRLRSFFEIQESTVCSKCVLKQSCKFVNQNVWRGNVKNLNLTDAMNVITLYALDAVPAQLVVPDELKASISRLLKEVLKLSQTIS